MAEAVRFFVWRGSLFAPYKQEPDGEEGGEGGDVDEGVERDGVGEQEDQEHHPQDRAEGQNGLHAPDAGIRVGPPAPFIRGAVDELEEGGADETDDAGKGVFHRGASVRCAYNGVAFRSVSLTC